MAAADGNFSADLRSLGLGLLRDLIDDASGASQALDDLTQRLEPLPDGAAACGQWRRARAALAQAAGGGVGSDLLLPPARLLQEIAHDRLHTGHWSAVPATWRDAHAAATLCSIGARLAMAAAANQGASASTTSSRPSWPPALDQFLGGASTPPLDVLRAALRALDVAIMLGAPGSPWLRAALDRAAERVDEVLAAAEEEQEQEQEGSATISKRPRVASSPLPSPTLPPRSLTALSTSRLPSSPSPPPLDAFLSQHLLPRQPLLIRSGLMDSWPAMSRWRDPQYFLRTVGRRTVPVEVGAHFLDPALSSPLVRFSEFVRGMMMMSGRGETGARAYLAQHPLLDQLPKLRRDVMVPDYCALGRGGGGDEEREEGGGGGDDTPVAINAWLGPPGTATPLHHDGTRHNLLCVVAGRKYVRLYPPGAATERALRPLPPPHSNASGLLPADLLFGGGAGDDDDDDPALAALDGSVMADAMVGPGQALYIPPGWWHYVSSWAEEKEEENREREQDEGAPQPPAPPYCFAVSFWF
jgi:lysine-specific demethylase 8